MKFPPKPPTALPHHHRPHRRPPTLLAAAFVVLLLTPLVAVAAHAEGAPELSPELLHALVHVETDEAMSATNLYLDLGSAAGVEVDFSPKLRDIRVVWSSPPQSLAEALDELGRQSATFWVATGPDSIFVAADTPQARRTYTPMVVASFPLRHASLGDAMTAIRTLYGVKSLTADETRNVLTVRDTAATVALTRELISRLDTRPPETLVKLELVAGDDTLLAADASIVGQGQARVGVQRSPLDETTYLNLGVNLEARTEGGEVLLDLSVESSVLRSEDENSHAATNGTWRSRDGKPFLIQLPLHLDGEGGRQSLALRVTPTVVDSGEAITAKDQWVGTEAVLRAPDTAP